MVCNAELNELIPTLSTALSNQPSPKVTELHAIDLSLMTTELLRNILIHWSSLKRIHLHSCFLGTNKKDPMVEGPNYTELFADGLRQAICLKIFQIADCGISDISMARMLADISRRREKLCIQGNGCGDLAMQVDDWNLHYINSTHSASEIVLTLVALALARNSIAPGIC
jgi:Ran GTPase-activating protein (RanGAP) involved in mRNA processing and transport